MSRRVQTKNHPATTSELWDLKWVREPQQDRSAVTRNKLMDAAEQLLTAESAGGVTIAKVTRLAGSSNGSFYHYFQDKNALLYAMVERRAIEVTETVAQGLDPEKWRDVPLIDILEGYIRFSIKSGKRSPGLLVAQRALAREDPNVAQRLHKTHKKTHQVLMVILKPKLDQIGHPQPKLALQFMLETLRVMINRRLGGPGQDTAAFLPKQSEETFIRELREMSAAYLQIQN